MAGVAAYGALHGRRSLAGMTALACVLLLLAALASLLLGAGDVGPTRALAVLLGAGTRRRASWWGRCACPAP